MLEHSDKTALDVVYPVIYHLLTKPLPFITEYMTSRD